MPTITGFQSVREALRANPDQVHRILLAKGRDDRRVQEIIGLARRHGIPFQKERREALDRRSPHHRGVVAEMTALRSLELDALVDEAPAPALLLALDKVEDPRNFGAIARTAESAGVGGLIVVKRGQAPASDVAISASAGALLHTRISCVANLADSLGRLKKLELWVVGLAPDGQPWFGFDYRQPLVLVVGSEGRGLRPRVRDTCDAVVSLPQRGRVQSLNVSVATGILLYEVVRQRGDSGGSGTVLAPGVADLPK